MYYHIRFGKITHDGREEMTTRKEWDFRSLRQGLAMIKRDFGAEAQGWRIEDLTDRKADLMRLECELSDALMSTHQYVIMSFTDDSPHIQKYDHYQFFIVVRDENERPPAFSFSEEEEAGIVAPETIFQPDYRRSIRDILKSIKMDDILQMFEMDEANIDPVELSCRVFSCCGGNDKSFAKVSKMRGKESLNAADYLSLGDECQRAGEDRIAAVSYAAAIRETIAGEPAEKGEALAKLACAYVRSDCTMDVMNAVDLLVESLSRGYKGAIEVAQTIRRMLFEDDFDEVDVDDFIRHYAVDALCFAGFCLGVGLGWKKDTVKAAKLFEYALAQGYERASHYLNEIRTGRV